MDYFFQKLIPQMVKVFEEKNREELPELLMLDIFKKDKNYDNKLKEVKLKIKEENLKIVKLENDS